MKCSLLAQDTERTIMLLRFNAFKSTIKLLGKIQIELILDNEKRFNLR